MPQSRGPSPPLPLLLLLAFLAGRGAGSSSHSLRYFVTSVSEPGQKEPQFFYVGYVDDQQFVSYDNITRRSVPKVPWITKVDKLDPHYWEQESRIFQNEEHIFRVSLGNLAGYYNQSRGAHTLQWMYGCELRKDGSKGGYWQTAYDGMDYLSFDKETLTWTAADVPAQNTKRKWEAEPAYAQFRKAYLEGDCIEWLRRYLKYGKETLLRTGEDHDGGQGTKTGTKTGAKEGTGSLPMMEGTTSALTRRPSPTRQLMSQPRTPRGSVRLNLPLPNTKRLTWRRPALSGCRDTWIMGRRPC